MPNTWMESLLAYSYPFDLQRFEDAKRYTGWFKKQSDSGDRETTIDFEAHFREHATQAIEPWLEVVFWKMYNQPKGRADKATRRVAQHLHKQQISPGDLWAACNRYVKNPTADSFDEFRKLLGVKARVIALASTFAAFMQPDQYPMVDIRIAKWVGHSMNAHSSADRMVPQLVRPHYLDTRQTVLTMTDFDFLQVWIRWCRHMATKLSSHTSIKWRARDVEMAVFNAWGGRHDANPKVHLNAL